MNVLVIGGGGREHALVMKIHESEKVDRIYCAPGNGGISRYAECFSDIKAT
ncbi:MAG: phosphoribosylamine--glycine ligase, partial [Oscillospiraceae bacterium]|nr:phosphoribosylamine--glycine ligase [Oscillospiraceae bacterium]